MALGAAVADGGGGRAAGGLLLSAAAAASAVVLSFWARRARRRNNPLGALPRAGADERGDLLPVEAGTALVEHPQERERREAPVHPGEAEVVRRDRLEGGSVLKFFFFFFFLRRGSRLSSIHECALSRSTLRRRCLKGAFSSS